MAFSAGLEQLPTCNQTNSFSLTKIVEQDLAFTDLLWKLVLGVFSVAGRWVTVWTTGG